MTNPMTTPHSSAPTIAASRNLTQVLCSLFLQKKRRIAVEGSPRSRSWMREGDHVS